MNDLVEREFSMREAFLRRLNWCAKVEGLSTEEYVVSSLMRSVRKTEKHYRHFAFAERERRTTKKEWSE